MKYQLAALSGLAATVAAQDLYVQAIAKPHKQAHELTYDLSNSILGVLQTALPESLVAEALTNSAAVASEIQSQFAAGETPSWYSALPTDVQGYLVPTDAGGVSSLTAAASSLVSSASIAGGNATSNAITSAPSVTGTGGLPAGSAGTLIQNGTVTSGGNGTSAAGNSSTQLTSRTASGPNSAATSDSTGTSGGSDDSTTTDSEGAAAAPTAFLGMGLAGALGVVGILAL